MGHVHLVLLPRTPAWRSVVGLLGDPAGDAASVAAATAAAAAGRLDRLRGDPALAYGFWLLVRLASAARGPDFAGDLAALGLTAQPSDSIIGFVSQVSDRVRAEVEI